MNTPVSESLPATTVPAAEMNPTAPLAETVALIVANQIADQRAK